MNNSRILIADDEAANRRLLETILRSYGYQSASVDSGPAALREVAGGGVDIVLLDVMMPGLDGIETCRAIRERLALPTLPVVLVTALTDHRSRARGKEAGADDFISKPVYEEELIARVGTLLRAKRYHEALDERARTSELESRRWRLVSRVAEEVASAANLDDIGACLQHALAHDLAIERPRILFDVDAAQPDDGALVLPLVSGGRRDGVLLVHPQGAARFNDDDDALLRMLAPHIANAAARVRLEDARRDLDVARARLTALVVHDMKNPLSVLTANVEVARAAATDTEASVNDLTEALDDARTATDQLMRMVLDLLDIGRAEDGKLPFAPVAANLRDVLHTACDPFRRVIEQRGARLELALEELPAFTFDTALITRVVQNLIANATRFAPNKGCVEVRARRHDGQIVIAVGNDGPRIPHHLRPSLFQKFGQVTDDQERANRGLGLYLCRLVAERHGGTISICDREPAGIWFEVRLPELPQATTNDTSG